MRSVNKKKKKLDLANMWADTILILFISICTALLGEGKSTNALINLLKEVKEFTPIQHVFTFVASMYECAVQV